MRLIIFIIIFGIIWIPVLIYLIRYIYKKYALSTNRAKQDDLYELFGVLVRLLIVDITLIIIMIVFIVELLKN